MAPRTQNVSSIDELIGRTSKLRRGLTRLLKRFPEEHLDLGQRIFVRLSDPVWRRSVGDDHGPYEQKEAEAIQWLRDLDRYLNDLRIFFSFVIRKPDMFQQLPLSAPVPAAAAYIRLLALQEHTLKSLRDEGYQSATAVTEPRMEQLRKDVQRVINRYGAKHCVDETRLSPDTVNDFLHGRTNRSRSATLEKLRQYSLKYRY